MSLFRREFLKLVTSGLAGGTAAAVFTPGAHGQPASIPDAGKDSVFDVTRYGAKGDGVTIGYSSASKM